MLWGGVDAKIEGLGVDLVVSVFCVILICNQKDILLFILFLVSIIFVIFILYFFCNCFVEIW